MLLEIKNIETYYDKVKVLIEDTGTGITKMNNAVRIGDRTGKETPLNEHGFGLKHALATANPENDSWRIYTRTKKEFKKNEYILVTSPYDFKMPDKKIKLHDAPWPGDHNGTGTIVQFGIKPFAV